MRENNRVIIAQFNIVELISTLKSFVGKGKPKKRRALYWFFPVDKIVYSTSSSTSLEETPGSTATFLASS